MVTRFEAQRAPILIPESAMAQTVSWNSHTESPQSLHQYIAYRAPKHLSALGRYCPATTEPVRHVTKLDQDELVKVVTDRVMRMSGTSLGLVGMGGITLAQIVAEVSCQTPMGKLITQTEVRGIRRLEFLALLGRLKIEPLSTRPKHTT